MRSSAPSFLCAAVVAACVGPRLRGRSHDPGAPPRAPLATVDETEEPPDDAETGRRGCTWPWIRGQIAGEWMGSDPVDPDGALRRFFPLAGPKPIVGGRPPDPGTLVFRYSTFPPYHFGLPIDWNADPHHENSWRLWFQSLSWLPQFDGPAESELDAGGAVLVQWANVLHLDPPLEFTWSDHALAIRLDRTARFLDRYVSGKRVLDRSVLRAGAEILSSHFAALGTDRCYHARHNHGVRQDLAILEHVGRYPAWREAGRLLRTAEARLREQLLSAVTPDGIQVENSPQYHLYYAEMLTRAIAGLLEHGRTPPTPLAQTRDRMLDATVYLLQPNLTMPQFGDSDNRSARRRLVDLLASARRSGIGDTGVLDRLEWVVTRGRRGSAPGPTDRVFDEAGYAAFREAWSPDAPSQVVTGHLKCGRLHLSHYRPDETSFEVYGRGTELLVNAGIHSYDRADRFAGYQRTGAAQNVLVIDERSTSLPLPSQGSCIVAQELGSEVSWVQATVGAPPQVPAVVRTFAFARPDTFVVVDHVTAEGTHRYDQHFHLHPSLSDVRVTDSRTVVARGAEDPHPGIALAAAAVPTTIEAVRGQTGDRLRGWYFPRRNVALPSTDVVFRWDRGEPELDFAVVLTVLEPGAEPRLPGGVNYLETANEATVSWSVAGRSRSVTVPRR